MLKAAMRDKKRYVAVEKKTGIIEEFVKWYGLRAMSDAIIKKIIETDRMVVYKLKPQYVEKFRVACMFVNARIFYVSGTLKALRRKMREEHGMDF